MPIAGVAWRVGAAAPPGTAWDPVRTYRQFHDPSGSRFRMPAVPCESGVRRAEVFHAGRLDEILIHRRALSPIEIQRTFAAAGRTSGSHTVQGNFIGTDVSGATAIGNGGDGILLHGGASGNQILDNLLSANGLSGVRIQDPTTTGNSVLGNTIGTDVSGELDRGNRVMGVWIIGAGQPDRWPGTGSGQPNLGKRRQWCGHCL